MTESIKISPKKGLSITFAATGIALISLVFSYYENSLIGLAMMAGAIGGLAHEFAQSGGTIAFFKVKDDGVYVGSLTGLVLGMISGLLFFQGVSNQSPNIILVQSLLSGLALKGISEAIGGQVVPRAGESLSLENVRLNVTNNAITVTVRNIGDIGINIARIYVNSQPWNEQNVSIPPERSQDFVINNIDPPIAQANKYSIRVITTKGTTQEGKYPQ